MPGTVHPNWCPYDGSETAILKTGGSWAGTARVSSSRARTSSDGRFGEYLGVEWLPVKAHPPQGFVGTSLAAFAELVSVVLFSSL